MCKLNKYCFESEICPIFSVTFIFRRCQLSLQNSIFTCLVPRSWVSLWIDLSRIFLYVGSSQLLKSGIKDAVNLEGIERFKSANFSCPRRKTSVSEDVLLPYFLSGTETIERWYYTPEPDLGTFIKLNLFFAHTIISVYSVLRETASKKIIMGFFLR